MKKIVFLLSLMFCATIAWAQNTIEFTADVVGGWTLRCSFDGNVVSVVGRTQDGQGNLTIPATVTDETTSNQYTVTSIGYRAFYNCTSLTSVTIPNSVTSIGEDAFKGCSGLTSVTIPNSVTSIGNYAFYGCTSLTSVTIPNFVTSIGNHAFYGCSGLTSVTIPNSVTSIGNYAFKDCSGLTSVTIPNSVTSIGDNAFYGCTGLTSVTIPNSVTSIGYHAFSRVPTVIYCGDAAGSPWGANNAGCYDNDSDFIYSDNTKTVLVGYQGARGDVTIPSSVTSIGYRAFYNFPGLTSVSIPNTVTSIGDYAFYRCTGLTNITIPNSVTEIGRDAFSTCNQLETVTFDGTSTLTSIGASAFDYCSSLRSIAIPSSVTSIGNSAFANVPTVIYCGNATGSPWGANNAGCYCTEGDFIYSDNTKTVLVGYQGASGDVTIPNSVTSIDYRAFYNRTGLTSVTIPNSVTSIGASAFSGCSGLISVTIPNSVTSIGNSAFANVRTVIYCGNATGSPWGANNAGCYCTEGDFIYSNNTKTVLVGYQGASGDVTIPNSVTSIGYRAFYNRTGLTSVTIPNSVTEIGQGAFSACSQLANVTFDGTSTLTSIGEEVFSGCSALTSITIPNSVTEIGQGAFSACSQLATVTFDGTSELTSIGEEVFSGCSALTSITIPSSVTSIGDDAFEGCFNLKTVYNLSSLTLTPDSDGNGKVAKNAKRVVVPTTSGSGNNAIYQIPETENYSFVDAEDDEEKHIPRNTIPTNFIYKDGGVWKAKNIVLTDCQDVFNAPETFTADHATYTRTFTDGNRSTLCLPFTTAIPSELEVYKFSGFNNSTLSFTQSDNIVAYTPYLVGKDLSKSTTDFTFTQTSAVFPATSTAMASAPVTHGNMTFQGAMQRTQMSIVNYGYKDGYFVQSGGSAYVNPFRCYFTWNNAPQNAPQNLGVDTDGDYLGIEEVEADAAQNGCIRYSNDVYDLMGRMVRKEAADLRGLPKGIYIWRGKKILNY